MKNRYFRLILLKIKWSPWNPWCLGRTNLAWAKYAQTSTYEGRKQLEKDSPVYFKDFAYNAFVDNCEIRYFINRFTLKDKIKLFFAPFSFGDKFRMPLVALFGRKEVKNEEI